MSSNSATDIHARAEWLRTKFGPANSGRPNSLRLPFARMSGDRTKGPLRDRPPRCPVAVRRDHLVLGAPRPVANSGAVEGGVERGDQRSEHPEPLCLGKREPHGARIATLELDAHDFGAVHHQDRERGSRTWPAVRGQWAELFADLEIVPIDSDHVAEGVIERLPTDPQEAPRTDHPPPREEVHDPLRWLEIELIQRSADLGLRRSLREDRRRVHALLRKDSAQLIEAYVSW